MASEAASAPLWLFGYGSLIFKPPPRYGDLRVPGYIEGYVRRFWQASEDHRGTPEDPGRVVTLIARSHWETLVDEHSQPPEKVWGAAYRIPPEYVAEVKEYLDIREINGYSIQYTPFQPSVAWRKAQDSAILENIDQENAATTAGTAIGGTIECLVYIGLPANPQFLGPQEPQALAEKIVRSRGPSGENVEYLLKLEEALIDLSPESEDVHISDLASRARQVLARDRSKVPSIDHVSTDGKEEVEKSSVNGNAA